MAKTRYENPNPRVVHISTLERWPPLFVGEIDDNQPGLAALVSGGHLVKTDKPLTDTSAVVMPGAPRSGKELQEEREALKAANAKMAAEMAAANAPEVAAKADPVDVAATLAAARSGPSSNTAAVLAAAAAKAK